MKITLDGNAANIVSYSKPIVPEKPSILLIHGAGMNASVWTSQGRYFAFHGWNSIVPELPGHGHSEGEPLGSITDLASWCERLCEQLNLKNLVIAGHSMGSLIALELAARLKTNCQALMLLGSTELMPVHPKLIEAAANDRGQAGAMIANWGLPRSIERRSQPVPSSNLHWSVRRLLENGKQGVLEASLRACNSYTDAAQTAASVTCPTLLLVGQTDRMASVDGAKDLAGKLKHAELRTVGGAEHMMLTEKPRQTLSEMRQFLASANI